MMKKSEAEQTKQKTMPSSAVDTMNLGGLSGMVALAHHTSGSDAKDLS